jgi:trimeric autotransporter adhesin
MKSATWAGNAPTPAGDWLTLYTSSGAAGIDIVTNGTTSPIVFRNGNNGVLPGLEIMHLDPLGPVGIGVSAPVEKLEVNGNVKATAFISTSDVRLKNNIQTVSGLDDVLKLRGVSWNWKMDGVADSGVIAQEVEKVVPTAVVTDKNTGMKAVKYNSLIARLIEAVKELFGMVKENQEATEHNTREIASLKAEAAQAQARAEQLEKENKEMKARLERIEKMLQENKK